MAALGDRGVCVRRELYYLDNASVDGTLKARVMGVPVTTTPTFSAGTPRMLFEGP